MPLIDMSETYQMTNVGDHIDGTDVYQSNPNLLDNAYFVGGGSQLGYGIFPINQRGQSSYTGNSIGMDRWRNNGNGTTVLNADNVTFSNTNGWTDGLNQRYVGDRFPLGSQVTFTVQMSDLSFHSCTITVPTTADTQTTAVEAGTSGVYFAVRTNNGYHSQAFIMCGANTSASIRRAKAELGTVSTLANDPPPDFGEELRKCQRYLWVLDIPSYSLLGEFAIAGDATNGSFVLHTPVEMGKTSPLVTITGDLQVSGVGAITGVQWATKFGDRIYVAFVTSGTMIANTIYPIGAGTSARITVSAEL